MDEQEKQYQKGFNHGYILAAHEPELTKSILDAARTSSSPYAAGLSTGHDIYVLEHIHPIKEEMSKPIKEAQKIDNPEKKYIKGFNIGYHLAAHEPKLAASIVKLPNNKNVYFRGIVAGKQEYNIEKIRARVKTVTPKKPPTKDRGKEK